MDAVRTIEHEGKNIIFVDFSEKSPAEIMAVIPIAKRTIAANPPASVLTLTDVTNGHYDRKVSEELKSYVAHNKPYVKAGAVVGLTDLKKIVFNSLNRLTGRNLKAFETLDEARSWLVSQ